MVLPFASVLPNTLLQGMTSIKEGNGNFLAAAPLLVFDSDEVDFGVRTRVGLSRLVAVCHFTRLCGRDLEGKKMSQLRVEVENAGDQLREKGKRSRTRSTPAISAQNSLSKQTRSTFYGTLPYLASIYLDVSSFLNWFRSEGVTQGRPERTCQYFAMERSSLLMYRHWENSLSRRDSEAVIS